MFHLHTHTHTDLNTFLVTSLYRLKILEGMDRVKFLNIFFCLNTSKAYTKIQSGNVAVNLKRSLGGEERVAVPSPNLTNDPSV